MDSCCYCFQENLKANIFIRRSARTLCLIDLMESYAAIAAKPSKNRKIEKFDLKAIYICNDVENFAWGVMC